MDEELKDVVKGSTGGGKETKQARKGANEDGTRQAAVGGNGTLQLNGDGGTRSFGLRTRTQVDYSKF